MSTIYYCDAPSCGKKEPGRPSQNGWVPPDGWHTANDDDKNEVYDACSQEHLDAIIAANTPEPEPEEEETEAKDE